MNDDLNTPIVLSHLFDAVKIINSTHEHKFDLTEKDINEFVDQFTSEQFDTMVKFFDTMPKMRHIVKVTNPKTKVTSEVVLEGLESFLE